MGFNLESVISDCEFRGYRVNPSKDGRTQYMSAYFEQQDERNVSLLRLSVPDEKRRAFVDAGLQKGEICTIAVRAIAGDGYNYMQYSGIIARDGAALVTPATDDVAF